MRRAFKPFGESLEPRFLLAADIVINEFLASNQNVVRDEDGDASDWIELLNVGEEPISLANYSLTDNRSDLAKWVFPDVALDASQTLLVFASDKDRVSPIAPLHTNFKLRAAGEYLALVDPNGAIVFEFAPAYPPQTSDVSYGLSLDLQSRQFFAVPTPNAPNVDSPNGMDSSQVVIQEIMYHPASDLPEDEYIEIYNTGSSDIDLTNWRFTDAVSYKFPSYILPADGTLVVAADLEQFQQTYGERQNVLGGWSKKLSDNGEQIVLIDSADNLVDQVTYADEGDWAVRVRGPIEHGRQGWIWSNAHDGGGKSLELINPSLDNDVGQNWSASLNVGGSPGRRNDLHVANTAALIDEVSHTPVIPTATDSVQVQARITDEVPDELTVDLLWRIDGAASFNSTTMWDDGNQGDQVAGDRLFVATVPAHADNTIIEFYVQATDGLGQARRFPNVNVPSEIAPNLLYQVDDSFTGRIPPLVKSEAEAEVQPTFRLIMTEAERAELARIGAAGFTVASSNVQMNGAFVSYNGDQIESRYNVGIRNRGKGSRNKPPNNYRVNFSTDQRWNDVTSINLNSKVPHAQVIGSAINHQANVVAANATAVQVRVNGQDLSVADPSMHGSYAYLEVIDSDFYDHHFPQDGDGNGYTGSWISRNQADLRDEGRNPDAYRDRYSKDTNRSEDDWTDLLALIDILNNTPSDELLSELEQIADVDQWLRYFAVGTLLTNRETSPANGIGDDYRIYRGEDQGATSLPRQRFVFVPHDHDSILGTTDRQVEYDIWLPAEMDGLTRLLTLPKVAQRYYATLLELMDGVLAKENANALVDQLLGSWVRESTRNRLLEHLESRQDFVRSQIPTALSVSSALPLLDGMHHTDEASVFLSGFAPAAHTVKVQVNGLPTAYDVSTASWTISVELEPGINRFQVISSDAENQVSGEAAIDIVRTPTSTQEIGGRLSGNTVLTHANTYEVTSDLVIPSGIELRVEPGTMITVADGVGIRIEGELKAIGQSSRPIRFSRRSTNGRWNGMLFVNTQQPNQLSFVDLAFSDGNDESILVDHAKLDMDHVRWLETRGTALEVLHPTLTVRHSSFPSPVGQETIHGRGLIGDEQFILEGNTFGSTTGYSDIIDFSGGQRPGPILHVIGNMFNGGSDDGLDLDGADAYIAGNVFRNIRKTNTSSSTSNAIATGVDSGDASEVVIVGNVFYDVDHALLLKERSSAVFHNNVVMKANVSAINMDEPNRNVSSGAEIDIQDSIFWQTETVLENIGEDPQFGPPEIKLDYSLVPENWQSFGTHNIAGDPGFVDLIDFDLRGDSPARGAGTFGGNIGLPSALVTAFISGEPARETDSTAATLQVFGPDIVSYRYRMAEANEDFGPVTSVKQPITLTDLAPGAYAIEVIGIDSRGITQSPVEATRSKSWTVSVQRPDLQISEVYANSGRTGQDGTNGDWIEIHNPSGGTVDLAGYSLTDDASTPRKFVFPEGAQLRAGQYLQIMSFSDNSKSSGLRLNSEGDSVRLYQPPGAGGRLVDQVTFGLQIPGFSIGRVGTAGDWALTRLTPNASNQRQVTGTATQLRINEWFANGSQRLDNDFVELANADPLPVDLSQLSLTDAPYSWPDRHPIADLSFIAANGFATFHSEETETSAAHLSFGLSQATSQIGLFDRDQEALDRVYYAAQQTDVSEGRDDEGKVGRFILPTPGQANESVTPEHMSLLHGLRLTELMYQPLTGTDLEFIEFQNMGSENLNLGGVMIDGGVEFTFPDQTLEPGAFILVVNDAEAFQAEYGPAIRLAGEFTGNLANEGERLRVELGTPHSVSIHRFSYQSDSFDWPQAANGGGYSLEIVDPDRAYTLPGNWRASSEVGGSPGLEGKPSLERRGDFNLDGQIDATDIDLLYAGIAANDPRPEFDLNDDGSLDEVDVDVLITDVLGSRRGDVNLNGTVGFADFLILSANFGANGGWSEGDFDGSGSIEFIDFLLLSANFER